jgi:hypothetical protein
MATNKNMKTLKERYDFIREIADKIERGEIILEVEKAVKVCNLEDKENGIYCKECEEAN